VGLPVFLNSGCQPSFSFLLSIDKQYPVKNNPGIFFAAGYPPGCDNFFPPLEFYHTQRPGLLL
jgi:hypothetical protein